MPAAVLIKVGTLDDPAVYGGPQMVIYTIDKQSFHHIPEGVPAFQRPPGRPSQRSRGGLLHVAHRQRLLFPAPLQGTGGLTAQAPPSPAAWVAPRTSVLRNGPTGAAIVDRVVQPPDTASGGHQLPDITTMLSSFNVFS